MTKNYRCNTEEIFWSRVDKTGPCWIWMRSLDTRGYGRFDYLGVRWSSHRLAWTFIRGPIPEGLTLDHLCRNRACCNPEHLEPVTNAVNTLRGVSFSSENARKTECPAGHDYVPENTYINPQGARVCRTCRRDRRHRSRAKATMNGASA